MENALCGNVFARKKVQNYNTSKNRFLWAFVYIYMKALSLFSVYLKGKRMPAEWMVLISESSGRSYKHEIIISLQNPKPLQQIKPYFLKPLIWNRKLQKTKIEILHIKGWLFLSTDTRVSFKFLRQLYTNYENVVLIEILIRDWCS